MVIWGCFEAFGLAGLQAAFRWGWPSWGGSCGGNGAGVLFLEDLH